MYAIASLAQGKNGVRSHVVQYKKGKQSMTGAQIAQVDTNEYRHLHKLSNNGSVSELMDAFEDRPYDYVIDVQSLTLHKEGCEHVGEITLSASIIEEQSTGLNRCSCLDS